jgi:hypothetical protein
MRNSNRYVPVLLLAAFAFALAGCPATSKVTLAPGGAYSDPIIFQADKSIDQAVTAMDGFIAWQSANSAYLAQWPEIAALAKSISTNEAQWVRDAYAARDAYIAAADAYRLAGVNADGTAKAAAQTKLDGLIAALVSVTTNVAAFRTSHAGAQ